MSDTVLKQNVHQWEESALQARACGDYAGAIEICEQEIEKNEDNRRAYWHLGLLYFLQSREEDAQFVWMSVLLEASTEEETCWIKELIDILDLASQEQRELENWSQALTIRQVIQTFDPHHVENLLHLVQISIQLNQFHPDELTNLGLISLLQTNDVQVLPDLLLTTVEKLPDAALHHVSTLQFVESCLPYGNDHPTAWVAALVVKMIRLTKLLGNSKLGCLYGEMGLTLDKHDESLLRVLPEIYYMQQRFDQGLALAKTYRSCADSLIAKIHACHLLVDGYLMKGSLWDNAEQALKEQLTLLQQWIDSALETPYIPNTQATLCNALFALPYFGDRPLENRQLQNNVGQIYQQHLQTTIKDAAPDYQPYPNTLAWASSSNKKQSGKNDKIRIGYLSRSLRRHSVGWLCRWLFHHHDREKFEIHAYFNHQLNVDTFSRLWFVNNAHQANTFEGNALGIAQDIQSYGVDILVDLDSLTSDINYAVLALKPAPIQVSWLGLDAPGLPTIDYFIVDPYVVPQQAQDYYSEKLWTLPQTYLAVDGFEVWMPTLSRDNLDIPSDAVVYFTAQKAFKLNPRIIELQLHILKGVPNSYLLIKGLGDLVGIQTLFCEIAEQMGVSHDRLRFLKQDRTEEIHRANLGIADVVLDTFPYNGATTTMETLWMELPLVTKVGQQFAARNSYTMMVNAGITEGIAWSDEEYIDWGIRLGKNEDLRASIRWKLHQSKRTAPLWDAKKFTRQMEAAYEQMWTHYNQGERL